MITVTTVDIKKTLTFTRCYSLTVIFVVVIVCTAVRRQAPALLAALPLLTQQDTSPTLHSFSSDHPFNWLWRPSGLGNSSFDLSRLFGSILYGCGPSYILVVIATSSSKHTQTHRHTHKDTHRHTHALRIICCSIYVCCVSTRLEMAFIFRVF